MDNMYKVFSVDVCFASYAIEYVLIGAKSREDLIMHLKNIVDVDPKRIARDDYRIKEIPNLFTDKLYTILDQYGYAE